MLSRCSRRTFTLCHGRLEAGKHGQPKPRSRANAHESSKPQVHPGYDKGKPDPVRRRYRWISVILVASVSVAAGYSGYVDGGSGSRDATDGFAQYTLAWKQPVSSSLSIFHLSPALDTADPNIWTEAWRTGIWNMLLKQPQIQVVRAYTPLPPAPGSDTSDLRFLIRHDPRGEVSSWLRRLPLHTSIQLKGPNLELAMESVPQHVTFLAGGTGIATALQAAYALLGKSDGVHGDSSPRTIHILWANRHREDCDGGVGDFQTSGEATSWNLATMFRRVLPKMEGSATTPGEDYQGLVVQEIEALKKSHPGKVFVDYFVDDENTFITSDVVSKSFAACQSGGTGAMNHNIIVSGPEGFITYCAGAKVWQNGKQEQGPVKGIVAEALRSGTKAAQVYKV